MSAIAAISTLVLAARATPSANPSSRDRDHRSALQAAI